MTQTVKIKSNTTNASAIPASLQAKEIAANILDRSLFIGDGSSVIRLYIGTTKYFDADGFANNALKLGGVAASDYATQTWVTNKGYLSTTDASKTYQTILSLTNKLNASYISGLATVATSGKYSDLSGTPTSLPASDVYAWAKKSSLAAADVPNLDWSKITSGKPTTLSGYGITDALSTGGGTITNADVGVLTVKRSTAKGAYIKYENTDDVLGYLGITANKKLFLYKGDQTTTASEVLHEDNYSSYALPKNGGTITGSSTVPLYIHTTDTTQCVIVVQSNNSAKASLGWSSSKGSYIYNYASGGRLGIKDDGTPYFGANTLVHSGNYTSFSPTRYSAVGANNMPIGAAIGYTYSTEEHGGKYTGGVINFGTDNYYAQLNGGIGEYKLAYRYKYGTDGFSEWRDIAFTNSNVASATKLKTARTIWGQSFDGSGNVSGDVILSEKTRINTTHLVFQEPNAGGWARGVRFTNTAGTVIGEMGGVGTVTDGLSYCYIAAGNYASNKALRVYSDGTIMSYTIQPLANLEYNLGSPTNSWGRVFTRYIDTLSGYDLRFCAGGTEYMTLTASNGDLRLNNGGLVVNSGFKITASALNILEHTAGGLHVGYGLTGNYITQIYGGNGVYLRYGADRSYGLTISSGGHTKVHKSFEVAEGLNVGKSIVVGEGLYMNNNQYMYCKDSNNAYVSTLYINNSNLLAIGYGTVAKGYSTAIYGGGGVNLRYGASGSNGLTIDSEGYTKIFESFEVAGNTYLSADVTITGQVKATGDIISEGTIAMARLVSSSDRKLKENIKRLSTGKAMKIVRALRPAEWDWKKGHTHSFGFIAQEVEPIVPEMVAAMKHLHLEYNQLHAFEVGAIQHIDCEVEQLKKDLKTANTKIENLENELKQYRRTAICQ